MAEVWRRKPGDRLAKKEYQRELSPIEDAAWMLVYSMIEAGIEPGGSRVDHAVSSWWNEDWARLVKLLKARGLNCDPVWAEHHSDQE